MPTFRTEDFDDEVQGGEVGVKLKDEAKERIENEPEVEEEQEEVVEADEPETPETPKRNRLEEIQFDDADIPEDLRGKIKTGKDLMEMFENTRTFARDLYTRVGNDAPKDEPAVPSKEKTPLFSEEDLGIGANVEKVEATLHRLVDERTEPFVRSTLQATSEQHAKSLFSDKENFPFAERFQAEILTMASGLDLKITAKPATWKNLYAQVVGMNAGKLLSEQKPAPTPKPKAPAAERGDNGSGKPSAKGADADFETRVKNAKLSPEQKAVCEAMNITEDAFIRRALKMGQELNGRL